MSGGPQYEYLWKDDKKYKTPTKLSAPEYILNLVEWIDEIINDERIFPLTDDKPFPKNFKDICKKIFQRLFRIFVHIYIEHFERLEYSKVELKCWHYYLKVARDRDRGPY